MARIYQTGYEPGHVGVHDLQPAAGAVVTTPVGGSWSTYSFQGGNSTTNGHFSFTATSELYHGYRFQSSPVNVRMSNYISPNGTHNMSLKLNAGGKLEIWRGDSAALLATGSQTLSVSIWYYIEVYLVISDTVGKYRVRINGSDDIALTTGVDTRTDAAAGGDTVDRICLIPDNVNVYVDDMYVNDTTGATNTGFSGDIRVSGYIPNAAGDVTGLTPTAGSNYTNVDERPPNDATDIVAASGTSLYDLYNIPNTSGVTTAQAATLWLRAQKSDAGAKNVAHKIKSGATEDTGADVALSTSWAYYGKVYDIDPTDSTAWTPTKINNLQIGAKAR